MVEIRPLGHASFRISNRGSSVVFDPFNPKATGFAWKKQDANLVLISCDRPDHNYTEGVTAGGYAANGAGEYEVSGVKARGIGTGSGNTIYQVFFEDFSFLHLGNLDHLLEDAALGEIDEVDILFVPTGGGEVLSFEAAAKVVAQIEPRIVVPMHYRASPEPLNKFSPVEKFIEEMGEKIDRRESLKFKIRTELPDKTEVIVLTTA